MFDIKITVIQAFTMIVINIKIEFLGCSPRTLSFFSVRREHIILFKKALEKNIFNVVETLVINFEKNNALNRPEV